MNKTEALRLGLAVRGLINSEGYKFAVAAVRADLTNAWLKCGLMDTDKQYEAKAAMTGLDLIVSKLAAFEQGAYLVEEEDRRANEKLERQKARQERRNGILSTLGLK
jgi:hypothetical protein